jgi:hypothetical protein
MDGDDRWAVLRHLGRKIGNIKSTVEVTSPLQERKTSTSKKGRVILRRLSEDQKVIRSFYKQSRVGFLVAWRLQVPKLVIDNFLFCSVIWICH